MRVSILSTLKSSLEETARSNGFVPSTRTLADRVRLLFMDRSDLHSNAELAMISSAIRLGLLSLASRADILLQLILEFHDRVIQNQLPPFELASTDVISVRFLGSTKRLVDV